MSFALQGTPTTACTEHELVAAVRRGDDRAFEVLFSRYERRITGYVAGMVGDHARAEDITQDVFISALRRMRATRRPIVFKPWIYEIAKNACIDEFRRTKRNQEVSFEDDDGSAFAARNVYVHAPPPQAAIESKQRLDDLCGAFGGLSETHHQVLVLRELEGLSYNEIAERLGMTRAMVESTLFRARRRLSEEYEELASGRRCARVQSLIDGGGQRPVTALGIRDRRQLRRHLAHCEPCRRQARIGGLDESLLEPPRRIARIAALLPLPFVRWRRSSAGNETVAQSGSHSVAVAQSLQNVAQMLDPVAPSAALGRAAAAAAAIALASAGGGLVVDARSGHPGAAALTPPVSAPGTRATVLSYTKILVPMKVSLSPSALAFFQSGSGSAGRSGESAVEIPGGVVGPVPAGSGSGGAPAAGGGSAGSGGTPGGGSGGGSGAGSSAGGGSLSSGGGSGGGVGVPSGPGTSPPPTPTTPSVPSTESSTPDPTTPPPPSPPPVPVKTPQTPTAESVQATVQSAPTTATQTATQTTTQTTTQVQQTASQTTTSNIAVSPPSSP